MGREDKYDLRLAYPTTPSCTVTKTSSDSVTPQHETINEQLHQCFPQITCEFFLLPPNNCLYVAINERICFWFKGPFDSKGPKHTLLALCDTFLLSHFLQIATRPSLNDSSLALTVRTWRANVESRYIDNQLQDTQWTELPFIRTIAAVSLNSPCSAVHKFV